jgi:hypothetical protein
MKRKDLIKEEEKIPLEKDQSGLKDCVKIKEEEKISSLVSNLPADRKEWFRQKFLEWLQDARDHPIMQAQRKAVALFRDRKFKLQRSIHYGNLHWKRGQLGWTLDAMSLGLLPEKGRLLLESQLQKPGISLCCLREYIYTLPNDYLRFEITEPIEQKNLF